MHNDVHSVSSRHVTTRRRFIQATSALVAFGRGGAAVFSAAPAEKGDPAGAAQESLADRLGITTFSFRAFSLKKTLAMTQRLGIRYLCLKSSHLPMDATPEQLAAIAAEVKEKGLVLYAGGAIKMKKPSDVDHAFEYAKHAGLKMLVIMPTAEILPEIEKKVKEYDVAAAIHNHGPQDKNFPTPDSAYEKIKDLDPRVALCVDIGHTVRCGVDLAASLKKCRDRVIDLHLKDVTSATRRGRTTILGRGVIDFPRFFRTLQEIDYCGRLSLEYEPEPRDPLPAVAQSAGYARGMLQIIEKKDLFDPFSPPSLEKTSGS